MESENRSNNPRDNCPCRRNCEYRGNCAACRDRHSLPGEKYPPACEKRKTSAGGRAGRRGDERKSGKGGS